MFVIYISIHILLSKKLCHTLRYTSKLENWVESSCDEEIEVSYYVNFLKNFTKRCFAHFLKYVTRLNIAYVVFIKI